MSVPCSPGGPLTALLSDHPWGERWAPGHLTHVLCWPILPPRPGTSTMFGDLFDCHHLGVGGVVLLESGGQSLGRSHPSSMQGQPPPPGTTRPHVSGGPGLRSPDLAPACHSGLVGTFFTVIEELLQLTLQGLGICSPWPLPASGLPFFRTESVAPSVLLITKHSIFLILLRLRSNLSVLSIFKLEPAGEIRLP